LFDKTTHIQNLNDNGLTTLEIPYNPADPKALKRTAWDKLPTETNIESDYYAVIQKDSFLVIDFDDSSLNEILSEYINKTIVVDTPRGGRHYYFKDITRVKPIKISKLFKDSVEVGDIKAAISYVVGCGSPNYSKVGNCDKVLEIDCVEILSKLKQNGITTTKQNDSSLTEIDNINKNGVNKGTRHTSALKLANSIASRNPDYSENDLLCDLENWNKKNTEPLPQEELKTICHDAINFIGSNNKTDDKEYKISDISSIIESQYHFKSTEDIRELFIYENGVYSNHGAETFIESQCEKLFKEPSTHKCNEVINSIKRRNPIKREDLAGEPEIYNFTNGLFSINEQKLSDHTPHYTSRSQFNFEYDESAKCPNFEKFLESSLPEEIKRENVLEDMASCFLSQLNFKKIILYVGEGYNGKSVLTNTLTKMLGENNVSHVSLKQFNRAFSMANLEGKFANIHSDIDKGSIGSLADLKVASTEDPLFIERKGKDGYTVQENPKLLFACNQPPELDEDTVAIFGRLRITEWEEEFLPNDPKTDPEITEKISGELSGIFNKLVPFIIKLKENKKFTNNESIEEIEESYLLKAQSSLFYAKNNLEIDFTSKTPRTEIYDDYKRLCFENKVRKESPTAFNKMIEKELGVHWKKERVGNNTIPCWNIKIKTDSVGFQEMLK